MAEIENVSAVLRELRRLARQAQEMNGVVRVGYTAEYAFFVHENLTASHRVGNAKYLEGPARRLGEEMAAIVRQEYIRRRKVIPGLLRAGLLLQRESQKEVPVDTGALKNSAFTRLEEAGE